MVVAASALFSAHAGNITPSQAKQYAALYMASCTGRQNISPDEMRLIHQVDNPDLGVPAAYFYNVPGGGWIIMAGTTTINPVIGYSSSNDHLDMDNLPANMRWWVDGYIGMVMEIQADDAANGFSDSPQWQNFLAGKVGGGSKLGEVYLMQENWGQGDPNQPTYNLYCPTIPDVNTARGIDSTAIVGCVATALSQICHYYRYPEQPKGTRAYTWRNGGNKLLSITFDTISFDYSLMPNRITSSTPMDRIRETAKLCRAVGYAVKMNYGAGAGSGAYSDDVPDAMRKYFKYELRNGASLRGRSATNDTGFVFSIRRELLKKNILYMCGSSPSGGGVDAGGHAWVCAGYNTNDVDMYFMNWGWNAGGNGFFNLSTNDMYIPGYYYNFNANQRVLLGMVPPDSMNRFIVGIDKVDQKDQLGTAYPNPATLSVVLPYSTDRVADLNIYAIDGKLVETRRVQAGSGEVEVSVVGMPAGVYIYRLGAAAGKFIVR